MRKKTDDRCRNTEWTTSRPVAPLSVNLLEELPRLWTVNDVAEFLVVSKSWVYHAAAAGQLPTLRFGGHLRFDPEAVRQYALGERLPSSKRA